MSDRWNIYKIGYEDSRSEKITDLPEPGDGEVFEIGAEPSALYVIDGYVYYRGYSHDKEADAWFCVPPGETKQILWDVHEQKQ